MIFFEDFQIPKDKSIGITNLLSNITTRPGSHKGGWTRLLKCQLKNAGYENVKILDNKDSISEYGIIIFDLGAEYSGALNLFGGLDEKVFKRLEEIREFKGEFFNWKNESPNLLESLKSRRTNASTCEGFRNESNEFLEEVQRNFEKVKSFYHVYRTDKLLIGDSHTPAVWDPTMMIERRDGRTLKGMLERNTIQKYFNQYRYAGHDINFVHVHCSSIDIRHHVHREENPDLYITNLARSLLSRLMALSEAHLTVTHSMGIEDESRKLPKTGYFKGAPFTGSCEQRIRSRNIFNIIMDEVPTMDNDTSVLKYPEYFFDKSGKLRFEVMEIPQSIHISPEHYLWDLDKNELRWTEGHNINMQCKFGTKNLLNELEKDLFNGPQ